MHHSNGSVHRTMRSKRMMATLAALVVMPGCASAEQFHAVVKERAAYDLQCEAASLAVTDLPGMAYGVRGCGRQATYVVTGPSCQNPKQLTKREVRLYCTPVLDHSAEQPAPPVEQTPTETLPPDDPAPEPKAPEPTDDEPVPPNDESD